MRALVPVPLRAAPPPRLRTSDDLLLDAARRWTDPGDVVFDWGCGSGRLLQHLDRADRVAVGIDVSHDLVDPLNAAGLCAHVSADAAITHDGPPPRAILMAELLEHLDDAAGLLAGLREHYPAAPLAVSVPSPRRLAAISGPLEPWDRPPEHLVRFTQEGLARLLARCGYEPGVHLPAPTGQDHVPGSYKRAASAGVSLVRVAERTDLALDRTRSFATGLLWAHALYVRIGRVVGAVTPSRVRARRARASAESMVAFARPR